MRESWDRGLTLGDMAFVFNRPQRVIKEILGIKP
jgi:hypothetical protein